MCEQTSCPFVIGQHDNFSKQDLDEQANALRAMCDEAAREASAKTIASALQTIHCSTDPPA